MTNKQLQQKINAVLIRENSTKYELFQINRKFIAAIQNTRDTYTLYHINNYDSEFLAVICSSKLDLRSYCSQYVDFC